MLIWDTGEYSILPYRKAQELQPSSSEASDGSGSAKSERILSESEKLHQAFQQSKIRLRLHGTRLPPNYTISLRLTKDNYCADQPSRPKRRRRKVSPQLMRAELRHTSSSEDQNNTRVSSGPFIPPQKQNLKSFHRTASPPLSGGQRSEAALPSGSNSKIRHFSKEKPSASSTLLSDSPYQSSTLLDPGKSTSTPVFSTRATEEDEHLSENEITYFTNAYPGATNSISSIHQRRWYLSLDRHNSGFTPERDESTSGQQVWVRRRKSDGSRDGFEKFYVLGREVERSVVTGRLAAEILADEGVEGFVPRRGWRAVVE